MSEQVSKTIVPQCFKAVKRGNVRAESNEHKE